MKMPIVLASSSPKIRQVAFPNRIETAHEEDLALVLLKWGDHDGSYRPQSRITIQGLINTFAKRKLHHLMERVVARWPARDEPSRFRVASNMVILLQPNKANQSLGVWVENRGKVVESCDEVRRLPSAPEVVAL